MTLSQAPAIGSTITVQKVAGGGTVVIRKAPEVAATESTAVESSTNKDDTDSTTAADSADGAGEM